MAIYARVQWTGFQIQQILALAPISGDFVLASWSLYNVVCSASAQQNCTYTHAHFPITPGLIDGCCIHAHRQMAVHCCNNLNVEAAYKREMGRLEMA